MTPMEKYLKLTEEAEKNFIAADDIDGMKALLAEKGKELTQEEREAVLQELISGKSALSDDELEKVSGGSSRYATQLEPIVGGCKKCGGDLIFVWSNVVTLGKWQCNSCEFLFHLL